MNLDVIEREERREKWRRERGGEERERWKAKHSSGGNADDRLAANQNRVAAVDA